MTKLPENIDHIGDFYRKGLGAADLAAPDIFGAIQKDLDSGKSKGGKGYLFGIIAVGVLIAISTYYMTDSINEPQKVEEIIPAIKEVERNVIKEELNLDPHQEDQMIEDKAVIQPRIAVSKVNDIEVVPKPTFQETVVPVEIEEVKTEIKEELITNPLPEIEKTIVPTVESESEDNSDLIGDDPNGDLFEFE